jgi:hypothetical protein
MHITASVFVNDDESGLHHDYEGWSGLLGNRSAIDVDQAFSSLGAGYYV